MQFSTADQTALIGALAETVTLSVTVGTNTSTTALLGDFRLESAPVQMYDGTVMSSAPIVRITDAVRTDNSIALGSTLICRSVTYTVAEMRQEQSGLWLLILNKS
jgi:hypothetical protein